MDCGQIQSLFTAFEDRELDQRNLLLFEHHLATCSHCAQEWRSFQKMLQLLQAVTPLPVPPDLLPGIHEKIAARGIGTRLGRALQKIFTPVPLTAAASMAAVLLVATVAFKTPPFFEPTATAVAPPSRMAPTEPPQTWKPPLVTLPVSLGQPKTDSPGLAPHLAERERNTYYHSLLEREGADLSHLATWRDHFVSLEGRHPAAGSPRWQLGPPLVPDVTIRVPQLSAEGLKWLHSRIQQEGRWQTRLYPHDYFLVLLNPDELPSLYDLLQRQQLPFSMHSHPEAERATRKLLLVAVRP